MYVVTRQGKQIVVDRKKKNNYIKKLSNDNCYLLLCYSDRNISYLASYLIKII